MEVSIIEKQDVTDMVISVVKVTPYLSWIC